MRKYGMFKRAIAGVLTGVMVFMLPSVHIQGASKAVTYVKDFKLYVIKNDNKIQTFDKAAAAEKAKTWFTENGYTMVDGNLNEDASGLLNKEVGVFIGYQTTTDPSEAVTDIALMNEQGGYSQSDFKMMLDEQKKIYTRMVDDMQTMIDGFRENYENNQPTALQVFDNLNTYYEDDSEKPLGQFLLEAGRDDIVKMLLQANTQVVEMVEELLAYAGDGKSSSWLDRMSKLGSYKKLEDTYIAKYKGNKNAAINAMKQTYGDTAIELEYMWPLVHDEIMAMENFCTENKLTEMTEEQRKAFFDERKEDQKTLIYMQRENMFRILSVYKYGDGTLYDYFRQPTENIAGENIKELYPIAASLTSAQRAMLGQTGSIITLIRNATGATVFNGYKTEVSKAVESVAKTETEAKKELDETGKLLDEVEKEMCEEPTSVYDGVDREIFKDGAAITSKALTETKANDDLFKKSLLGSGGIKKYAISLGISTLVAGAGLCFFSKLSTGLSRVALSEAVKGEFQGLMFFKEDDMSAYQYTQKNMTEIKKLADKALSENNAESVKAYSELEKLLKKGPEGTYTQSVKYGYDSMKSYGNSFTTVYNLAKGLKVAFAVILTALAAADIYFTVRSVMDYYNRDHLDIPHHMRDVLNDPTKETSFIDYTSVRDQNGACGDVNGGGGKQWLALYQTKDKNAGDPIIAPESGGKIEIKTGAGANEGSLDPSVHPLHMFETPETPQNLTDEAAGYSFNDKKGGIYMYFTRGEAVIAENGETDGEGQTATAATPGVIAMIGGSCLIFGVIIGAVCVGTTRRRRIKQ